MTFLINQFCLLLWHQEVIELDNTLKTAGGMARFGNDDGYAIGPASILFPAIANFAREVKEKHLLELQVQKTEVFSWDGLLPPQAPPNMKVAGVSMEGSFFPGMVVYGIPVGTDKYVQHMLEEVVNDMPARLIECRMCWLGKARQYGVCSIAPLHTS